MKNKFNCHCGNPPTINVIEKIVNKFQGCSFWITVMPREIIDEIKSFFENFKK